MPNAMQGFKHSLFLPKGIVWHTFLSEIQLSCPCVQRCSRSRRQLAWLRIKTGSRGKQLAWLSQKFKNTPTNTSKAYYLKVSSCLIFNLYTSTCYSMLISELWMCWKAYFLTLERLVYRLLVLASYLACATWEWYQSFHLTLGKKTNMRISQTVDLFF